MILNHLDKTFLFQLSIVQVQVNWITGGHSSKHFVDSG